MRSRSTFGRWGRQNVHETVAGAQFHMSTTSSSWKLLVSVRGRERGNSGFQTLSGAKPCIFWGKVAAVVAEGGSHSFVRSFILFTHSLIHSFFHSVHSAFYSLHSLHSSIFFNSFHFNSLLSKSPGIPISKLFPIVLFSKLPPRRVPGTTWYISYQGSSSQALRDVFRACSVELKDVGDWCPGTSHISQTSVDPLDAFMMPTWCLARLAAPASYYNHRIHNPSWMP